MSEDKKKETTRAWPVMPEFEGQSSYVVPGFRLVELERLHHKLANRVQAIHPEEFDSIASTLLRLLEDSRLSSTTANAGGEG